MVTNHPSSNAFNFKENKHRSEGLNGNSGVYTRQIVSQSAQDMFIYNVDPNLIYIGSSLNIGRRIREYNEVLVGVRSPTNLFTAPTRALCAFVGATNLLHSAGPVAHSDAENSGASRALCARVAV